MVDMKYLDATRVDLHYELPLGEIVYDFFDAIKSRSRGYASYDYEMKGFRESKLVKSRPASERRHGGRALHDRARRQSLCQGPPPAERLKTTSPARCSRSPSRRPSAAR